MLAGAGDGLADAIAEATAAGGGLSFSDNLFKGEVILLMVFCWDFKCFFEFWRRKVQVIARPGR